MSCRAASTVLDLLYLGMGLRLLRDIVGRFSFDWGANATGPVRTAESKRPALRLRIRNTSITRPQVIRFPRSPTFCLSRRSNPRAIKLLWCRMSVALPGCPGTSLMSKVSLGYRADFFFGAIDGGIADLEKRNARILWSVRKCQYRHRRLRHHSDFKIGAAGRKTRRCRAREFVNREVPSNPAAR